MDKTVCKCSMVIVFSLYLHFLYSGLYYLCKYSACRMMGNIVLTRSTVFDRLMQRAVFSTCRIRINASADAMHMGMKQRNEEPALVHSKATFVE